jgi:hypothetical protein
MKEIINKISSYNLFNVLLPGIIFIVFLEEFTQYSIIRDSIIINLFIFYFVGILISRFGSLLVEPLFKKIKLIKFSNYDDFVKYSKIDKKINILSETNNMYRTFISTFILILILKIYEFFENKFLFVKEYNSYILIIILLTIFICAYRKQINYINKRIKTKKTEGK